MAKAVKAAIVVGLVATGVGALTGAVASGSAFSLFGSTLAKGSLSAYFATQFTTSLVLGAVSQAMTKNASGGVSSGSTITGRGALSPHQVIYGRTRVGGNIVYMEGTEGNKYLHVVVAIAGHEIDAIEKYYLNDEEVAIDGSGNVTAGSYANKVRIQYKLGTDDQTAFSDLVSASDSLWTSNHRLRGRAVVYIRLEYDQDKFPSGMPNFSFQVRGKKVYDPRSATTVWSANPALCIADYLTNSRYGLGCVYANEIDETALIAAANVCDEDVTLDAGGTENKYELHGSILTSGTPEDIINQMLTAMAGKAIWTSGKWRILAGAYYTPALTFDEDDLRAGFTVQSLVSRRENFNCIKGVFVSAEDKYMSVDFPPLISDAFIALDNGETVYKNITLPFTTSVTMAQRLSKIELLKARQQITLTLPLKLQGLKANVGDIVYVNNTRLGWSSKPFEVVAMSMSFDEALGVDLDLREISTDVFSWSTSEEQAYDPAPNTSLPNAFSVSPVTNLSITATNVLSPDGATQSGLLVTWTPPVNSFVTQYEVQYIRGASNFDYGTITSSATVSDNYGLITGSADTFADYGAVSDPTTSGESNYNSIFVTTPYYVVVPAIAGVEYAVRVRAVNTLGVRSSFVTSNEITYGDQDAPNVPSSIVASPDYKQIVVTWVNPTVADFDYVEVYRNTTNNSGTATLAGVLRGSRFVDAPLGINVTRYYWLKSVDRTGNKSGFSSVVSATTEFVDSDSFSQEVLNLFSEAGAYGIEPVATLPATGDFDGQIKFDTVNNKLWRWDAATSAWTDDIFSIEAGTVDAASFAAGIEPISIVTSLPSPTGYTGPKLVFLTTDNTIYRYTGSAWTSGVDAEDISGTLPSSAFSQSLRPVEIVSALPSSGNFQGRTVMLTSDNKLYRYTGTAWTSAVPSTDISGTVSDAQIAGLSAAKVTGQLTNSQIADVATAKLTGTISGSQIADAAISAVKIASSAVTTAKIATDAITADVIAANAITATKISDGAIETAKISAGAITTGKIAAGAITASEIAANAITADAIAADSITSSKIAAGAVTASEISAGAVTAAAIDAGAVTTAKLAAGAVTADTIAANAITSAKIEAGAVVAAKIAAGSIETDKLAAGSITTAKIAANAITATEIAADSITSAKIATGAITATKVQAGAIGADQIAANAITTGKIAAGAISADQIAANAIVAGKIAADAITTDKIAANAIQTDKIAANSITGGLIAAAGVITSAAQINDAVITNAKIANAAITTAKIDDAAITSAKIGDAAITSAKIGTAEVGTLKIAGNAVTVPASAFTSATYLNTSGTTWQDAQTISLTTSGSQVYITSSGSAVQGTYIDGENTGSFSPKFRLVRGTTVLMEGSYSAAMSYSETPAAGTYTYKIQVYSEAPSGSLGTYGGLSNRSLFAIETKR